MPRVRVRNAADPEQVAKASRSDQFDRDRELKDLHLVADTVEGRRVLWRILGHVGTFASTFDRDPVGMAYRAGQQDVGHWLTGEIGEAHSEAWMLMQIEANAVEANRVEPEPTDPNA